jgi:hypothetical protein
MKSACFLFGAFICLFSFTNRKENDAGHRDAAAYSTDVLNKWMAMQIRLMGKTTASFNGPFVRIYSYSGLAAYEALLPGISKTSPLRFSPKDLNGLPDMPLPQKSYHWPSCVNAALAFMNKAMFPMASSEDRQAIDSLEAALGRDYSKEISPAAADRAAAYGKEVARMVFNWAESDGYATANNPYSPPKGPGLWVPTPPAFTKPSTPYWGNLRPMVAGTVDNSQPPPPPPYSTDTASVFYKEVHQLFEASLHLTPGQQQAVLFWREINPGVSAPGHWLNILRQVLEQEGEKAKLDKGAFAYALSGIALNDAWISCWKTRYRYNVLRPVTYIQDVMQHRGWMPLLPTPPHPEYSSGFAAMAGAVAEAFSTVFGDHYALTDHTYDYLGMDPRMFTSFYAMAREASDSKMLGGIHFQFSVDRGLEQGQKAAQLVTGVLLHRTAH